MTVRLKEGTSGTTLDTNQGTTFRAPGLTTGKLTGDAKAMNLGSDSDDDSDLELIELDMCVISKPCYFVSQLL